jgi:hypothetical protein
VKVGEGTYGEAFKVGNCVCKIVPFDGDFRVNGEIQKVTVARLYCYTNVAKSGFSNKTMFTIYFSQNI